jgi:hypothetical protein
MIGYSDADALFLDEQKRRVLERFAELKIDFKLERHERVFTVETAESKP